MDTIMIQDTTRIQGKLQEKIDSYSGMLFKIAYARMGNRADAEDIVQETFYQYFKASREFEDEEYEKAWLIRVALNGCNKMWRSSFHRRRSEVPDPEQIFAGEDQETKDCGPEEAFLDKEEARAVLEAVRKLPVTYRDVIHLFYYEDYTVHEIADILRITESNVKVRLSRGRVMLKEKLREEWEDDE